MPTYKYEAAYPTGEKVSGVIEAMSQQDAVNQIRQTCEVVLSLKEVPKLAAPKPIERFNKISPKALSLTCQQFAIILKAGLPLVRTVDLVASQCADKTLKRLLEQVSADVTDGWAMSHSIELRSQGKLPATFQETIRAGEESGDLVVSFERLSEYFDRMSKTRDSVVGALTYPAFLGVVAVVVAIIAILVAISIPLVNSALEKARKSTDEANLRAAKAAGVIYYLDQIEKGGNVKGKNFFYYKNRESCCDCNWWRRKCRKV